MYTLNKYNRQIPVNSILPRRTAHILQFYPPASGVIWVVQQYHRLRGQFSGGRWRGVHMDLFGFMGQRDRHTVRQLGLLFFFSSFVFLCSESGLLEPVGWSCLCYHIHCTWTNLHAHEDASSNLQDLSWGILYVSLNLYTHATTMVYGIHLYFCNLIRLIWLA